MFSSFPTFPSARFRSAAPLLAALLIAGCTIAPVPLQEPDHQTQQSGPDPRLNTAGWTHLRQNLETALAATPESRIDSLPEGLRVTLPAANGFPPRKTGIIPGSALSTLLQRIAPALRGYPASHLQIVAHSSSTDSEMFDLRLTIQRAETIMEQLRREGIEPARMSADGRGKADPVADNATAEGRARNQRVELHLTPR